ncbi:methyl-accepting chemotaxis protein [Pararhizobium sp.]|uniref:methyl-accepting chemotaxis protein n=1 Tax=Pararhizobium sp. TaxID=1977563 RepID=UPI002725D596|nr:HAMP domain-containing methyl-accepting chemotaxis protein [Pararhizobium sp.]MDO9418814.1 HAMP domain-containing methyl-accepting chemotaxis protein [Pararhizobium sp.]
MTTPAAKTRDFSVSQRLATLAGAALLGFGSMLAVGWYQSASVTASLNRVIDVGNTIQTVNSMRIANLELVLVAMDSIIDRGEGKIQPERLTIVDNALKVLNENKGSAVELAAMIGKPDIMASYDADLVEMTKAIQVDLKTMVEKGAPLEAFDAIDDTIDSGGERMTSALAVLVSEGGSLVSQRVVEAKTASNSSVVVQFAIGLVAILSLLALLWFHGNVLRRGIFTIRSAMQRILGGDLDTPVDGCRRGDEIGDMARSAELFRVAAIDKRDLEEKTSQGRRASEAERESRDAAKLEDETQVKAAVTALGEGLNRLSDGNLAAVIERPFRQDLESLRLDFNHTVERLQSTVGDIKENSGSIQSNSQQMRNAADDLAKRTEQQAASLEETSAALEEITANVKAATQRAEEVSKMVDGTRASAEDSGRIVSDAMSAMGRIENASNEIGKIINVIDEIAFQTNLLALNAGVEAARAGDAGKGFAVVAQEVRELAQRAAGAAKDIKGLVGKSGEEVKTGVKLVQATREALDRIGTDVVQINHQVKSIVTSAREQSTGLQEINVAVSQMDQVTQQNAAMVEETNAVSHTLAQDAENLSRLVGQFKTAGGAAPTAYASPRAATANARSAPSPAKALLGRIAGAFDRNSSPKIAARAASDNWEEF